MCSLARRFAAALLTSIKLTPLQREFEFMSYGHFLMIWLWRRRDSLNSFY
jgi:hypothetical protein